MTPVDIVVHLWLQHVMIFFRFNCASCASFVAYLHAKTYVGNQYDDFQHSCGIKKTHVDYQNNNNEKTHACAVFIELVYFFGNYLRLAQFQKVIFRVL